VVAAVGETGVIADGWPTPPAELPKSCRCDGIGTPAMGMIAPGDSQLPGIEMPDDATGMETLLVVLVGPGDVVVAMPRFWDAGCLQEWEIVG